MTMHKNVLTMLFGFVFSAIASPAFAGNGDTDAHELAQKKLDEADKAKADGKLPLACQLYEESFDLEPDKNSGDAFKTEYDLIECWVQLGQYSDAYFRMVKLARRVPDEESKKGAVQRAQQIKQDAPCIVIGAPANLREIVNLEVAIDGVDIPRDYWAPYCWPVNVGIHSITVKAPGKTWENQSIKTAAPKRQYPIRLADPTPSPSLPQPPPSEPASKLSVKPAIGIGLGLMALGGILWASCTDKSTSLGDDCVKYNIAAATLGGIGGGIFATGLGVYVAVSPPTQKAPNGVTMNVGVAGHF